MLLLVQHYVMEALHNSHRAKPLHFTQTEKLVYTGFLIYFLFLAETAPLNWHKTSIRVLLKQNSKLLWLGQT